MMARKRRKISKLSAAQQEIMEIVWKKGEVAVSDVRATLSETRDVARNTVRTLLERMEEKGWLKHRVEGRTYLYSATQPRQTTIGQKVVDVVDEACGGSPEQLVTALIDFRGLTTGELDRIRKMLADAKAKTSPEK